MKKIIYILIFIFILYCGLIFLIYPNDIKRELLQICELWLFKVLLSIIPFYFLSNILISFPLISKVSYKFLDKILHFECEKSCSLLLLSTITGNPTSSLLVINSVKNNQISTQEGNRLLRCTVISSPLFVISMIGQYGFIVYIIEIFVSLLFYYRRNVNKTYLKKNLSNQSLFEVLDNAPYIMLSILSSMIFVGLLSICSYKLFQFINIDNNYVANYFIDLFELTTGLDNITRYSINNDIKLLLSTFLLSFGGIAIIFQILNEMKKTSLSKTSLILSRICHGIITCLISFLFIKFFI